jgi:hydroxyacyl-ACP dehydratase HTD2-like protein with hotdog domain
MASIARAVPRSRARCISTWPNFGAAAFSSFLSALSQFEAPISLTSLREGLLRHRATAIFDNLTPTPSHLLNIVLSDYLPQSCWPKHFDIASPRLPATIPGTNAQPLPQGHHLVYFAPQLAGSQLLSDGTDPAHSPGAPWSRRMWAGGSVSFVKGWEEGLKLDGRRAVCVESVEEFKVKGKNGKAGADGEANDMLTEKDKIFVDVVRRYGRVKRDRELEGKAKAVPGKGYVGDKDAINSTKLAPAIEEVRTLVFMQQSASPSPGPGAEPRAADARIVRGKLHHIEHNDLCRLSIQRCCRAHCVFTTS